MIFGDKTVRVYCANGHSDGSLNKLHMLLANNSEFLAAGNSCPVLTDWNNDGLLDLLLGSSKADGTQSEIRLYINSGSKNQYLYTTFSVIEAADGPIKIPFPMIQYQDLNGDKKKDLILGTQKVYQGPDPTIVFFQNIGTISSPKFAQGVKLKNTDGKEITNNYLFQIGVSDWNDDGNMDILWTTYPSSQDSASGYIKVFLNQTSPTSVKSNHRVQNSQGTGTVKKLGMCYQLILPSFASESFNLSVYSISGKKMFTHTYNSSLHNTITFTVPGTSSGVFVASIEHGNTVVASYRIIHRTTD